MNLTLLDNQSLSNSVSTGAIDWVVVWHYSIIVLVMVAAALISWVTVNYLFKRFWK